MKWIPGLYRSQNQECGVQLLVHLCPEDQARLKVEETIDKKSRMLIHLLYNTKRHFACIGNYQEWKGYAGLGQESRNKSQEKGEAAIQRRRGKEEREWCIGVEQGRAIVLLHDGEKLERGEQFQGAIFCADQWGGRIGSARTRTRRML